MARQASRNDVISQQTRPTPPPAPVQDAEDHTHSAEVQAIVEALSAEINDLEDLKRVEAGRAALATLSELLTARLDKAKGMVAEFRQTLKVLKRRQYSARGCGIFSAGEGCLYNKRTAPQQFAAIVATGKIGVDFEFLVEG